MSTYTTGEIAKKCNVSVRTVQYYDSRGILSPQSLTDGGRRLYSEEDVQKLQVICFLRELGFSIHSIAAFLTDEHSKATLAVLIEEQLSQAKKESEQAQTRCRQLEELSAAVQSMEQVSVTTLYSVASTLESKKGLRRIRLQLLIGGLCIDALEIATFVIAWKTGMWWLFALGILGSFAVGVALFFRYMRYTDYLCPQCHHKFHPGKKECFFASHTPRTRKLRCPNCGQKGFCVEIYTEKNKTEN